MGSFFAKEDLLKSVSETAERSGGRLFVMGRYHRLPAKLTDDYEIPPAKPLGSGYNGSVVLAKSKTTGQKFAVKGFQLHGITPEKKSELVTEANIFISMDHPHVARLVDVYEGYDQLSLVMECMEGGELFDRVTKRKFFSERDAVNATWQMLLAVNYIHSRHVVHRDLKLENFLYEHPTTDHLKLIDFGFSKIWEKNTKMELSCGTLSYVAPEVLTKSYDSQCDLWGLGVIVFILLVGYMPFSGRTERDTILAIKAGTYNWKPDRWANVSESAQDFVKKLLVVTPATRLTSEQALQHPWIFSRERTQSKVDNQVVESLRGFALASQFRRACMEMMAWSLSTEERAEVRDAFLEMDTTKSGVIKLREFQAVLKERFDVDDEDAGRIFAALDANHDEEIHYSDFLAAMMCTRLKLHEDVLKTTFRRFDADGCGYITMEDLETVIGPETEISSGILAMMDSNKDGKVDYDEFIHYLRSTSNANEDIAIAADAIVDRVISRSDSDLQLRRMRRRDQLLNAGKQALARVGIGHGVSAQSPSETH